MGLGSNGGVCSGDGGSDLAPAGRSGLAQTAPGHHSRPQRRQSVVPAGVRVKLPRRLATLQRLPTSFRERPLSIAGPPSLSCVVVPPEAAWGATPNGGPNACTATVLRETVRDGGEWHALAPPTGPAMATSARVRRKNTHMMPIMADKGMRRAGLRWRDCRGMPGERSSSAGVGPACRDCRRTAGDVMR